MESDDNFVETLAADRLAWEEKAKREEEELAAKFRALMEAKEEDLKKKELEVCSLPFFFTKQKQTTTTIYNKPHRIQLQLTAKRESMLRDIENKKSAIKLEEEEVENQLADIEEEDD